MEALGSLEKSLYDAAATGDTIMLRDLLKNDSLLAERVSYTCANKTPLHVATIRGHLLFIRELLNHCPQLAEQLDSQQSSPLHIASAKGNLEVLRELLLAAPGMCLFHDCQGRNPLHLAVINGRVEVLEELFQQAPVAAREKLDRGFTALHLCVKHRRLPALKILLPCLNDLIDARDDDGDTLLHMAVRDNQLEIIQYLIENTKMNVNAKNSDGKTAMDILQQNPNFNISKVLKPGFCNANNVQTRPEKWLTKKRDSIMVVAILIATMAFQAGVTPPGGVWQDDSQDSAVGIPHRAGEAVMSYRSAKGYRSFIRCNTIAFVSSLSTILLLISGLPFKRRLFMWILMVIMWLTVTSIAVTYAIAITVVTPSKDRNTVGNVMEIGIAVWCSVMGILLIGNTLRLVDKWLRNRGVTLWRPRRFRDLVEVENQSVRPQTV